MDPEVACRCQLLHRQVTGAAGVRYKHSLWIRLWTAERQAPPRGSVGVPPARGVPAGAGERIGRLYKDYLPQRVN